MFYIVNIQFHWTKVTFYVNAKCVQEYCLQTHKFGSFLQSNTYDGVKEDILKKKKYSYSNYLNSILLILDRIWCFKILYWWLEVVGKLNFFILVEEWVGFLKSHHAFKNIISKTHTNEIWKYVTVLRTYSNFFPFTFLPPSPTIPSKSTPYKFRIVL